MEMTRRSFLKMGALLGLTAMVPAKFVGASEVGSESGSFELLPSDWKKDSKTKMYRYDLPLNHVYTREEFIEVSIGRKTEGLDPMASVDGCISNFVIDGNGKMIYFYAKSVPGYVVNVVTKGAD